MKHLIALALVIGFGSAAQASDPPSAEALRLQSAETAVRGGANHPSQMIVRKSGTESVKSADGFFPLHRDAAGRDLPLPTPAPQISADGRKAMLDASTTRDAMEAFHRARGLSH